MNMSEIKPIWRSFKDVKDLPELIIVLGFSNSGNYALTYHEKGEFDDSELNTFDYIKYWTFLPEKPNKQNLLK